jgi:hypothetical protein
MNIPAFPTEISDVAPERDINNLTSKHTTLLTKISLPTL